MHIDLKEIKDFEQIITISLPNLPDLEITLDFLKQLKIISVANRFKSDPDQVEKNWEELWSSIVYQNGKLDLDLVKAELSDYARFISSAAEVYCHITGGLVSKINTCPWEIKSLSDDRINKLINEYKLDLIGCLESKLEDIKSTDENIDRKNGFKDGLKFAIKALGE